MNFGRPHVTIVLGCPLLVLGCRPLPHFFFRLLCPLSCVALNQRWDLQKLVTYLSFYIRVKSSTLIKVTRRSSTLLIIRASTLPLSQVFTFSMLANLGPYWMRAKHLTSKWTEYYEKKTYFTLNIFHQWTISIYTIML